MPGRVVLEPEPTARGKLFWTWDGTLHMLFGKLPARMVIAGYELGERKTGLVIISPLEPTEAVVAWLQQTGQVTFIVAPSKQHWWWASAMKQAFPAALLVAPLGLAQDKPQLPVDVRITPLAGVQDMPGAWPQKDIDVLPVQGAPLLDELLLLHKPSKTLIITDLGFNFDDAMMTKLQPGWLVRSYLKWANSHRRCCPSTPFKWMMKDPVAVKSSLDHLLATCEFNQVSVAHGSFIANDGKQAFLEGTYAFVDEIVKRQQQKQHAAAADGGGGGLAGTGVAMLTAGAVIATAVGIGVAGIMQARGQ